MSIGNFMLMANETVSSLNEAIVRDSMRGSFDPMQLIRGRICFLGDDYCIDGRYYSDQGVVLTGRAINYNGSAAAYIHGVSLEKGYSGIVPVASSNVYDRLSGNRVIEADVEGSPSDLLGMVGRLFLTK